MTGGAKWIKRKERADFIRRAGEKLFLLLGYFVLGPCAGMALAMFIAWAWLYSPTFYVLMLVSGLLAWASWVYRKQLTGLLPRTQGFVSTFCTRGALWVTTRSSWLLRSWM